MRYTIILRYFDQEGYHHEEANDVTSLDRAFEEITRAQQYVRKNGYTKPVYIISEVAWDGSTKLLA